MTEAQRKVALTCIVLVAALIAVEMTLAWGLLSLVAALGLAVLAVVYALV